MRYVIMMCLFSIALAGCNTPEGAIRAHIDAQAKLALVRTVDAECTGPCRISYTDPRDRQTIRMPTNGWDALSSLGASVERVVTGAVLPAAGVAIVREVRRAGSGGNVTTTTTTSSSEQIGPDSNNTTTTTTSGDTIATTDSHDQTAPPTVVIRPDPVVLRPEIVFSGVAQ